MRTETIAIALAVLVAGCAEAPVQPYGNRSLAFEHGTAAFWAAQNSAKRYCAQAGLQARHVGTDYSPGIFALSRFECG